MKALPPDPDRRNDERAGRAKRLVDTYLETDGFDVESVMSDIITDFMHWADRNEVDPEEQVATAAKNYMAETGTEPSE